MKLWFFLGAFLALLLQSPGFAAALLGLLGIVTTAVVTSPALWGFAAGLAVRRGAAHRFHRST